MPPRIAPDSIAPVDSSLETRPILRRGATGDDVILLQERLGIHGQHTGVDSIFGGDTRDEVIAFQTAHGLTADGVVGPQTWLALLRDPAPIAAPEPIPPSAIPVDGPATGMTDRAARRISGRVDNSSVTPGPNGSNRPSLSRGANGAAVMLLQRWLGDVDHSLLVDGDFGGGTNRAVHAFQTAAGLEPDGVVDAATWSALRAARDRTPKGMLNWRPNAGAVETARGTQAGKRIASRTPNYADIYRTAADLTGVPAILIAAVHANESGQGVYAPSVEGPESGYGLDDRWVSTKWGNDVLAGHGLGSWQRGQNTRTARLQSAVVAGAHLQRIAGGIGISIDERMSSKDLAGLITGYMQGQRGGRAAFRRDRSWMFDVRDPNPHPRHPGGTSRNRHGQTVRVRPERKSGLLRWDVLLPLIAEQLG